ncbi:MAG: hypothetical protein KatS3mg057_1917 [Herpetosiphonaceae bacterium]|nr:MAG: hypothetical protein KatS3mg057_1917 [Herpetosiphonaceae bacterium]
MERRIVEFIMGMRAAGVRISIAESEDCMKAVRELGIEDRGSFRETLRATLVKDVHDFPKFDELFPLYFGSGGPPMRSPSAGGLDQLRPEDMQALQQAIKQLRNRVQELIQRLLNGEQLSRQELERFAQQAGLQYADTMRDRLWIERRMQQLLGLDKLEQELQQLMRLLEQAGMAEDLREIIRQQVEDNAQAMREQIRQHVGAGLAERQAERYQQRRGSDLMHKPFNRLTEEEAEELRKQVRRLAAQLRSRAALRQRRANDGQIDVRRTMRVNLRYGGVPLELRYRRRHLKPRLVLICDVSTSMRPVAEFMLRLVYELQDQVSKTRSFAFIDTMHEISQDLSTSHASESIQEILYRIPPGHYNTDLGASLATFIHRYFDATDRRTTVIVLGDGRNNYNDPRLDLVDTIRARAKQVIWLTPEPQTMWGTGDSDMHLYAPRCDAVHEVSSLAQLIRAIDRLLV